MISLRDAMALFCVISTDSWRKEDVTVDVWARSTRDCILHDVSSTRSSFFFCAQFIFKYATCWECSIEPEIPKGRG